MMELEALENANEEATKELELARMKLKGVRH